MITIQNLYLYLYPVSLTHSQKQKQKQKQNRTEQNRTAFQFLTAHFLAKLGVGVVCPLRYCYRRRYITGGGDMPPSRESDSTASEGFSALQALGTCVCTPHSAYHFKSPCPCHGHEHLGGKCLRALYHAYMTRRERAVASGAEFRYCHFIVFIVLASPCPRPYPVHIIDRSSGYRLASQT